MSTIEAVIRPEFTDLANTLQRLSRAAVLPSALRQLWRLEEAINTDLGASVKADIPAFSESHNPDVLPELAQHGARHTQEILRLLGGSGLGDFDFVAEHARRRAEQRFPLEATLHAYRCGHKVFYRYIREAVLAAASNPEQVQQEVADIADFSMEYTDTVSTIATAAYVAQTRLLAEDAGDTRSELLNYLLAGYDEADGRAATVLRNGGYLARRQSHCVAVAQSVNPAELLSPERARRMVASIGNSVSQRGLRHLINLRDNKVVIIFSANRRASGWTAPHTSLATQVGATLQNIGNAVLIGVSNDVPSTALIPNAYHEAQLAFELAGVGNRVVEFGKIPTLRLLQTLAGEAFGRLLPDWARSFYRADDAAHGALSASLRAYADADMNVLRAAGKLAIHANTLYARLQKIADLSGLDARHFHALTELLVVIECRPKSGELAVKVDPAS